ncbi:MAG: aminodeoxychorismate/anthranilate synthase component II [Planctomycetaceae bacterium]
MRWELLNLLSGKELVEAGTGACRLILLIDNYDSFVYNLARYVAELGGDAVVLRNDAATVDELIALQPQGVILSPGPCTPGEAGVCVEVVRRLAGKLPILGVCLGHQAISAAFGGDIIRAPEPVHGRTSLVKHEGAGLFAGLPNPMVATRYHSLVIDETTLPEELRVVARSEEGIIMGVEHRTMAVYGVQFHPESILTQGGHHLLANFLRLCQPVTSDMPFPEYTPAVVPDDFFTQPIAPNAGPLP